MSLQPGPILAAFFEALPRYEYLGPLGRGAMGVVLKARDRALDETIAIKLLWDSLGADQRELLARFKGELSLNRRIKHRNVCRIHDYGVVGEISYLTMEYVEGRTLAALLDEEGTLLPGRALPILRQIAEGAHAAHAAGVVHRDLKPANVMLGDDGHVSILDFGLAKREGAGVTNLGFTVGTPHYVSPEQAQGLALDGRSDIYAIGVIAFELFTGKPPFDGPSPLAVTRMHVDDLVPVEKLRPKVPPELLAIVLRCLRKDPTARYATAAELAEQLATLSRTWGIKDPGAAAPQVRRPTGQTDVSTDVRLAIVTPSAKDPDTPSDLEFDLESSVSEPLSSTGAAALPDRPAERTSLVARRQPVVIVVDDEPAVRAIIREHLRLVGCTIIEVGSAERLLELLTDNDADLVLLDVNLPGMDGFDAVRIVHSQQKFQKLPVIMMSSYHDRSRSAFAHQAGAEDFLQKPLDIGSLVAKVTRLLEGRGFTLVPQV
ncbi:MAG: protein kinase [Acidobacteria bacterium]|nr:protein kinase [Acidobacteriota bacterium]